MKDRGIDYSSVSGFLTAGKIYFGWIGVVIENMGMMTTNAIKMDWETNDTNKVEVPKVFNIK